MLFRMISFQNFCFFTSLLAFPLSSSAFLYECYGLECAGLSENYSQSNVSCNSTESNLVFKDPRNCHNYYICSDNGTATKVECPDGYGFHEEWLACVPENMIQNCSAVYCPEYIYDGVLPDPHDCRHYYRCNYGFPRRSKCPRGSVFEAERGRCKRYPPGEIPDCLIKPVVHPSTTTTTTPPPPPPEPSTTVHTPIQNDTSTDTN